LVTAPVSTGAILFLTLSARIHELFALFFSDNNQIAEGGYRPGYIGRYICFIEITVGYQI
jgi:hypothetical protein